ncbi:MAG: 23S rRNA (uracil(1939)-C(5))-methyltransferase RlmD, partial [Oscillospiraceae bacterium]|nr:23S rRNA (uracil(1939)-C(5))-methyltransferase RlmD [Oscillospiraceae bacterium]
MYKCCPVAKKCSGCQLQNMSYEEQLVFKQNAAEKYLSKFGTVNKIIGMYYPYHYRNKVQAYFIQARGGKIVSGVYQSKTKGIAAVDSCMIEDKKADEIVVTIRNLMKSLKLTAYDRTNDAGFLRHVLIRRAFKTGQIMVVLAASTPLFPNRNVFIKQLLKAHPEITTIIHNIADDKTETMVLGEREIILHGNGYIEDVLCGCKFRISSKSFYQINPQQTEVLYKKAMEYAGLTGREIVVDSYSGIGTLGIIGSKKAGKVISVELNKQAVKDAIANAKLNNLKNIRFYNDDATEFMVKMADEKMKADVLIMDPPRAGSTKEFLEAAIKLSPSRIVYISCNPETQEKDLMRLTR